MEQKDDIIAIHNLKFDQIKLGVRIKRHIVHETTFITKTYIKNDTDRKTYGKHIFRDLRFECTLMLKSSCRTRTHG